MSSPVTTAVGGNSVQEIRTLMKKNNIQAIPIIQYTKQLPDVNVTIRGIVTLTDISNEMGDKTSAEDVMTSNVHVVHKNSSAHAAAKMMLKHKVHHLVVMDDGKIVGIISSLDFVTLVAEHILD
jgi:CBS domain-containing protein